MSLHDNTFIRYFRGHKGFVEALEVSPLDDTFLSASQDNSVRLWDLRSSSCQGLLKTLAPSFLAYDPTAVLFAVGAQTASDISLYDVRNFDKQPFSSFRLPEPARRAWDKIEFSNTGKSILLGTQTDTHYLYDSFTGDLQAQLKGHTPVGSRSKRSTGQVCFSGDGRFVFSGSADNKVVIWDTKVKPNNDMTLFPILSIESQVGTSLTAFNPKTMLLATADTSLVSFSFLLFLVWMYANLIEFLAAGSQERNLDCRYLFFCDQFIQLPLVILVLHSLPSSSVGLASL